MEINVSNIETTNMFETLIGVTNIAPIKISGQYKIVVDNKLKLWLDDYTGRRVAIDKTISFLEQVANFLQVGTTIPNNVDLRYGAFQRSGVKSYHIPFYFGNSRYMINKFPKYFCLTRVPNETINHVSYDMNGTVVGPDSDLYQMKFPFKYGEILNVIDLTDIGLHAIIDEINDEKYFEYPLYFNWEDNNIKMFGYGINECYPIIHTIDIINSMANQPYLEVLNNKILNTYQEKKFFYPRFLNIEFEFEYTNEYTQYNNFMGYLSERKGFGPGNKTTLLDQHLYVKIQDLSNGFKWKQVDYFNDYKLDKYLNFLADGTINEINERLPQFRFKTYRIQIGDYLSIYHPANDDLFEYEVTESDIVESSLLETWIKICNKCTKLSGRNYVFTAEQQDKFVVVTIVNQLQDVLDEEAVITIPNYYVTLDRFSTTDTNYNKFRGITLNDIWLCGQPNLTNTITTVIIPNEEGVNKTYTITEKFKLNDSTILRLNIPSNIKKLSRMFIFEDLYEEIIELVPTNFLTFYSDCKSELPYDFQKYRKDLETKFINEYVPRPDDDEDKRKNNFLEALKVFSKEQQEPLYQYVNETENNELIDIPALKVHDVNEELIKNIMFNSMGCTTYMTPHLLNIDKQCFTQNGCVDANQDRNDKIRYNWFLINGECPKYAQDDIRCLRYLERIQIFTTDEVPKSRIKPRITSRLLRISDTLCETIFLGVKYQFPVQYEDYDFCTYLNFNNQKDSELSYNIELFVEEKLMMLSINKYLDFNDLIRGGNDKNEPLLDLSLLYNISQSVNQSSDYLFAFKTCGIKLEPFYDHVSIGDFQPLFDGKVQHDWIVNFNGEDFICIQREITASAGDANSFKLLFPNSGNAEFYVYSKVKYNDIEYTYISMTITIIGIRDLQDDYLWCSDLEIKFFDTKTKYLRRVDPSGDIAKDYRNPEIEQILSIDEKNIVRYEPLDSDNTWSNNHAIAVIVVDKQYEKFELLLPDRKISLKQEYFEIIQKITENPDGSKNYFKTVFRFKEFNLHNLVTDTDIINRFDTGFINNHVPDADYDKSTYTQRMTLFDRNQIWRILQDVLSVDLKFKYLTEDQIKLLIDDFSINKLMQYTDYQSLQIITRSTGEIDNIQFEDLFVKVNVVDNDKNLVIWPIEGKPKVTLTNRYRTAYLPYMQICKDYFDFQIKEFQKYGTVWNIYDEKFGGTLTDGTPISATGLWQDVVGNIISSLFCKTEDIKLETIFSVNVNYRELLIQTIRYEDCIITDDNNKYIESLNKNHQKYIIERYADTLLEQYYKLDYVMNELGQRLQYTIDNKKPNILHFQDKDSHQASNINFRNLIFILKRK